MTVMIASLNFQGHVNHTVIELRSGCSPLKSQYSTDKCWLEKKSCFIPWRPGEKVDLCPKTNSEDSA